MEGEVASGWKSLIEGVMFRLDAIGEVELQQVVMEGGEWMKEGKGVGGGLGGQKKVSWEPQVYGGGWSRLRTRWILDGSWRGRP